MSKTNGFALRSVSISDSEGIKSLRGQLQGQNTALSRQSNDFTTARVKPVLFEKSTAKAKDYFGLSDGFKKMFSKDKKDQKMILPISGYGGHTRGDRSQNFYGKTWRECALQSKKIQRKMAK